MNIFSALLTPMALLLIQSAGTYYSAAYMAIFLQFSTSCPEVGFHMNIEKFSDRLSRCMKQSNLSGAELSALSGVTAATISRYINGLREPSISNLVLLSEALNVSIDYLIGLHDVSEGKSLIDAYSIASRSDKRVIWTLLEKYGGKHEAT